MIKYLLRTNQLGIFKHLEA